MADDDLRQQLADRFAKGIAKSFSPCPLIGPKWMQACPGGKPADYRFLGVRKLAKAIGTSPGRILKKIMPNIALGGLDVDVQVTDDFTVLINRTKKDARPAAAKAKSQAPARAKLKGAGGPNRSKKHNPKPRSNRGNTRPN